MKKILFFCCLFVLFLSSVSGAAISGKINIYPEYQVIRVPLVEIEGKLHIPRRFLCASGNIWIQDVLSANFNSDRVGWTEDSVASTIKKYVITINGRKWLKMTIPNTLNNDLGTWTIKTTSGFLWMNIDQFRYVYPNFICVKVSDLIRYGKYRPASITFSSPGVATLRFNSNGVFGFIQHVSPEDIKEFIWNSDEVGWLEESFTRGVLSVNSLGNYIVVIRGLLATDIGTFSVHLKDGSIIWLNIDGGWKYGKNIVLDSGKGQMEYSIE